MSSSCVDRVLRILANINLEFQIKTIELPRYGYVEWIGDA
jgi:hypothetical protein